MATRRVSSHDSPLMSHGYARALVDSSRLRTSTRITRCETTFRFIVGVPYALFGYC